MTQEKTGKQLPEEMKTMLSGMPGGVFIFRTGADGREETVCINQEILNLFEMKSEEDFASSSRNHFRDLVLGEDYPYLVQTLESLKKNPGKTEHINFRIRTACGLVRLVQVFCRTSVDSAGGTLFFLFATDLGVQSIDGTDSVMDPVTELMGMRPFFHVMNAYREENNVSAGSGNLVVLYYDIIDFRLINLNHGMSVGDSFLRSIGQILRNVFPEYAVAHFEADHFAVLCGEKDVEARAEDARKQIAIMFPEVSIDIRVGACLWDDPMQNAESACSLAKLACDHSKTSTNSWFTWYSEDIGKRLKTQEYVTSHIQEAVDRGWIRVYYQPIIRVISGQICSFEALARWQDPVHGMLSPAEFIEPLESSQKITMLDLYVIRSVCRHQEERSRAGNPVIPVSVNLSPIDFDTCDIFAEIEKITREYHVPRRNLHIEITESALASDEGHIHDVLDSFRSAGYEVLMDDFGSAYSTFNFLKDYQFDVLKIDMAFLRKDTRRSRFIISSITAMDKKLGNRTIAEGVETREQFEFLKACGCDKVQGYYFGRPLPENESIRHCLQKGIGIETVEWNDYYDSLSRVDFMTDVPIGITEFCEGRFHTLFMNPQYRNLLRWMGTKTLEETDRYLNSDSNAAVREFRRVAAKNTEVGRTGTYYFETDDMELQLNYRVLASFRGRTLFVGELSNISKGNHSLSEKELALQNIRYFYDDIYIINLRKQFILSIMETGGPKGATRVRFAPDSEELKSFLPSVFYADRGLYRAFIDPATIPERIRKSQSGILTECFRTADENGGYTWKAHRILLVPHEKDPLLLYTVRTLDMAALKHVLADIQQRSFAQLTDTAESGAEILWQNIVMQCPLPLFWKDADRQFLGASRSFLDYYGFESADILMGKTDDDMNWHPDNEPYRTDEKEVLSRGECHLLVPGKCIARGVTRNILATKWPIRRNGRVTGLMGFFLDEDMVNRITGRRIEAVSLDPETGVENLHGILDDFVSCMEDFRNSRTPFAVILVTIPGLSKECEGAADQSSRSARKTCADIIVSILKNKGSVARFSADQFVVLCKYRNPEDVVALASRIRSTLREAHSINGRERSLFAWTQILYAEDTPEFEEELFHAVLSERYSGKEDPIISDPCPRSGILRSFLEEMPVGVCIVDPDMKIDFWNTAAEELTGYTQGEMLGKYCGNTPIKALQENGLPLSMPDRLIRRVLQSGMPLMKHACVMTKDGRRILVRNTCTPLRDKAGTLKKVVCFIEPEPGTELSDTIIQSIYEMASLDTVTGLPGRRYLETCLNSRLEDYQRTGNPFAVLFADIDNFHDFNNRYGHEIGDRVLRKFGDALSQYTRRTDCWGRWGGDEFVAIFSIRNPEDTRGAAERFYQIASGIRVKYGQQLLRLRISIGITVVRENDCMTSIVSRADKYMFEAKAGKWKKKIVTDEDHEERTADGE